MENEREISQDLEIYRKKAAAEFVKEFIKTWQEQGFRVDDLIDAIASLLYSMKNDQLDAAVRKLEEAAQEYRDSQIHDQFLQQSSSD